MNARQAGKQDSGGAMAEEQEAVENPKQSPCEEIGEKSRHNPNPMPNLKPNLKPNSMP